MSEDTRSDTAASPTAEVAKAPERPKYAPATRGGGPFGGPARGRGGRAAA